MGTINTGRKHLRERNREGLERWLAVRKPSVAIRVQLLRDTLGIRECESLRGTWLEASAILIKSLAKSPLAMDTMRTYWEHLQKPESWDPNQYPFRRRELLETLDMVPKKHQPEALDQGMVVALMTDQEGLLQLLNAKSKKDGFKDLPRVQKLALSKRRHDLLEAWVDEGNLLHATTVARAGAMPANRPFFEWLMAQPAWPSTPETLFETAVICGMARMEEDAQRVLAKRLMEWGVADEGWLEVHPARDRYLGNVCESQLACRLRNASVTFVREIPHVRMSMDMEGRLFVGVAWKAAWPTYVHKISTLHQLDQSSPETVSRPRQRF